MNLLQKYRLAVEPVRVLLEEQQAGAFTIEDAEQRRNELRLARTDETWEAINLFKEDCRLLTYRAIKKGLLVPSPDYKPFDPSV